jgi:hypothetical protein
VHLFWEHLFTDIIAETGSPARAVQAINTLAARMLYTQWLSSLSRESDVSLASFADRTVPVRYGGYAVVVAVVAVQIALLVICLSSFRRCRYALMDNAWLVISQVSSSPEVAEVLARGSEMYDSEVKGLLVPGAASKASGRDEPSMLVMRGGTFQVAGDHGKGGRLPL